MAVVMVTAAVMVTTVMSAEQGSVREDLDLLQGHLSFNSAESLGQANQIRTVKPEYLQI